MKPLVIYVDMSSDKITLTKKQFEEYIKQAYDQGYADHTGYYPYRDYGITLCDSSDTTVNTTTNSIHVKGE